MYRAQRLVLCAVLGSGSWTAPRAGSFQALECQGRLLGHRGVTMPQQAYRGGPSARLLASREES
jgi:hypothetical protein